MSQVVTLYKDKEKTDALYPRTKVSAISDDNNTSLQELLNRYEIIDNLTSYDKDKALSANQGRVLNSTKVNTSDIVDNLTSTDTDKPLSANQGKELKTLVDGKANSSHTHDDRYYTESEINTKVSELNASINGKANSSHTHSYNDLTNKPTIPSALSLYPIGSVYFSVNNTNPSTYFGGTWVQIGSKLAVRENVVGNGKTLGLTNGSSLGGFMGAGTNGANVYSGMYGTSVNTYLSGSIIGDMHSVGVPTKAQLGSSPQNSGLIVDTETIYSWKRTA